MKNSPHALIATTQAVLTRRRLATILSAGMATCVVVAVAVFFADALIALPTVLRQPALPLWLLSCAGAMLVPWFVLRWLRPSVSEAVRVTEQACDDHLQTLTTALALQQMPGELAQLGAARLTERFDASHLTERLPAARVRRWFLIIALAIMVMVCVQVALPRLTGMVLPRFTDPSGDHPPFSLTQVAWAQSSERVRVGDVARFEATIMGPGINRGIILCAQFDGSDKVIRLPMFQVGTGRFAGELSSVQQAATVWVEGGGTRTHHRRLAVDLVPVLSKLELAVDAPIYARLETERQMIKAGQLGEYAALPGSRLTLLPVANRPISAVWIGIDGRLPIRLSINNNAVVFEPALIGTYAIALESNEGVRSDLTTVLRVRARTDEPPRARIALPGNDALATPGMTIPLQIEADDDLGLVNVMRVVDYNQLPAPEQRDHVGDRRFQIARDLPLKAIGVSPGDVISLTVVAKDSRPDAQLSPGATRHIRIISEAEYNKMLLRRIKPDALERKYQPFTRDLAELEAEMAELKKQTLSKDALDKKLSELVKKAAQLQRNVQALKRETPLFAIEPQVQEQLEKALEEMLRNAEKGTPSERGVGKRLAQDLALMSKLARAQGFAARLRQLIDAEQNTTERFVPLAEHRRQTDSDHVRLRELADQETTLASALDDWSKLAFELADDLRYARPSDPNKPDERAQTGASQSADLLESLGRAIEEGDIADDKRQAAAAARRGDGVEAHRLAAIARDKLLALLPPSVKMSGMCQGEASLRIRWGDAQGMCSAMAGLCAGMGMGWGMGGVGSGGMGLFLGYGGDDMGGSLPSDNLDLYGPENLGDISGNSGEGRDGIAAMAASGAGPVQPATNYQQQVRTGTAAARTALSPEQQRLVDDYYRLLEGAKP